MVLGHVRRSVSVGAIKLEWMAMESVEMVTGRAVVLGYVLLVFGWRRL